MKNALEEFISEIKNEKEKGMKSLNPDALIQRLEYILKTDNEINEKQFKLKIEQYKNQEVFLLEIFKKNFESVIMMGQSAMKSAMLFNGAACIAFIAFLNNNISRLINGDTNTTILYESLLHSLSFFGTGALAATIAYGITYITQDAVLRESNNIIPEIRAAFWQNRQIVDKRQLKKMSTWVQLFAILFVAYSYFCAWNGMQECMSGFSLLLQEIKP